MENNLLTKLFNLKDFKGGTNYAIEASAGTGKTYSITEIVKLLLLKHEIGLDKILIVTYTEKAAGELKNRIREAINKKDKETNLSIKDCLPSHVNCDVDNASIFTIHSFCKTMISQFAISSNQPVNLSMCADEISKFATFYIRKGHIFDEIIYFLKFDKLIDEDKLIKKFSDTNDKYYLSNSYKEDPSVVTYETKDEDKYLTLALKLYEGASISETIREFDDDLYEQFVLAANSNDQKCIDFMNAFMNFKDFCNDGKTITQYGIPGRPKKTDFEYLACKELFKLKSSYNDFKLEKYLVDKYHKDFYKSFQEFKAFNRLQSFNDMIRVVREEIIKKDSKLLKKLQEKYTYGIIDEFQDTNQIQFDIFKNIFMSKDHNIIVVGDPKQSIYSYQGADVSVYQKAVKEIEAKGGYKRRLGKNYRSSIGVVEFGNELFKYYPFKTKFEPSEFCLLGNPNEKERRLKFKDKYCPSLWLNNERLNSKDFAKFAVEQIINCVSKDENGHTNLQVSYVENEKICYRDVSFKDFVVLARSKSEMPFIQNALKYAGIPAIRYKDPSLFDGYECAHWIAVLEALDVTDFTGENREYFKKALFTCFFELPLNEIAKEMYDKDDIPQIQMFAEWKLLAKQRLWQDLFDSIIIDTKLDDHLSSLSELQSLAKFKQIANYCIDYLSNDETIESLVKHLKSLNLLGSAEDFDENSGLIAKSTEFDCVRIMTMHASKGLQFPVVISVAGFKGVDNRDKIFYYHRKDQQAEENRYYISYDKPISEEDGKTDIFKQEQLDEAFRLYYVAYTRPEFLLIAPRYEKVGGGYEDIHFAMDNFLTDSKDKTFKCDGEDVKLYELKDFEDISYSQLKEKTKEILSAYKVEHNEEELKEQKEVLKKLIKEKKKKQAYKKSYSSLAHPKKDEESEEILDDEFNFSKEGNNEEQEVVYDLSGVQIVGNYNPTIPTLEAPLGYPKGAYMGDSIHEVFEKLDFTNYESYLERLIIEKFEAHGFKFKDKTEWISYTKEMVNNVLNAELPIIKGNKMQEGTFRLSEISSKDKKAEIEFNFNYPNEVLRNFLNGFIDLLFKRDDVYSILDWKSDILSDEFTSYSNKDELKKQVDKRYSIQRVLYSYTLIKWLKSYYNETEEEIFKNHFGGIYYVFVRGCNNGTQNGIYAQTWNSYDDLKKEFFKIINGKE